jgi:hypothetical protein
MKAIFVHQQHRVPISVRMVRESAIVFDGILFQFKTRVRDAMDVPIHEH